QSDGAAAQGAAALRAVGDRHQRPLAAGRWPGMSISARITYVRAEDLLDDPAPSATSPGRALSRGRQLTGVALALLVLPLLTLALDTIGGGLSLEGQVLLYLLAVVGLALVGGLLVALPS